MFGLNIMSESVKKLSFKDMDFKFMAAYGQYSEKFDAILESERRTELNDVITQLYEEKISYQDFYIALDKEIGDRKRFHRTKISTSRKFAYRENERKVNRIKRHK
ncbi:hypothetical protein ACFL0D_06000 [Thermoproteota archaeon]